MSPKRLAACSLVQVVLRAPCSQAFSSFQPKIPNGKNVKGCDGEPHTQVGHIPPNKPPAGGPKNPFGLDFKAAGATWTTELCNKDSDGDGQSNGMELGDPSCKWVEGGTPERTVDITHPGLDCTVPVAPTPAPVPPPLGLDSGAILLLHGICMILAWGLTYPMGAAVALVWKPALGFPQDAKWFKTHQRLQTLGGVFVFAGFGLAVSAGSGFGSWNWTTGPHKLSGFFVVLLTVAQMMSGYFRPAKPASGEDPTSEVSKTRSKWLLFHRVAAFFLLVWCIFQCYGGIELYGLAYSEYTVFLTTLLVIFLGISVVFLVVGKCTPPPGGAKGDQVELKS